MADLNDLDAPRTPLRIGVWIESVPDVDFRGEGIARTLAAVLRSLAARPDTHLTVALARWNEAGFRQLLEDWRIPPGSVTLLVSRSRDPIAVRVRRRAGTTRGVRARIEEAICRQLQSLQARAAARRLVGISSWPVAALLITAAALAGAVMLPFVALAVLLARAGRWIGRRARRAGASLLTTTGVSAAQAREWLGEALIENEFHLLADRANREAAVDVWFVTHPASARAARLAKPLVVAVPDLVYVDFPTLFPAAWAARVDEQARVLLGRARATISYSRYVADHHVVDHIGVDPARAHVIPHAPFDVDHELAPASLPGDVPHDAAAIQVIRRFFDERTREPKQAQRFAYHRAVPFDEIAFLFVASQVRPTKNYLNLFRAYRWLVRERYHHVKLVVTGDFARDETLKDYVERERLGLDILAVPNLPSAVHAAFMRLAALTVVPTLFEGGFPFPFSESLGMGTPVLMSDIPVTRPVIPEPLRPLMLFDPFDVSQMASRIEWALEHRADLFSRQQALDTALRDRTWDIVAGEYRAVFAGVRQ